MKGDSLYQSVKQGQPRWNLLDLEGIKDLPAVKWELLNIARMYPSKTSKDRS